MLSPLEMVEGEGMKGIGWTVIEQIENEWFPWSLEKERMTEGDFYVTSIDRSKERPWRGYRKIIRKEGIVPETLGKTCDIDQI